MQASFDPADTLLWQVESKPLPLSPTAPLGTQLIGTQSGVHPFSSHESFCGEYSDLQDRAPSPGGNRGSDLRGQTYRGNVLVHHSTLELPSSRRRSSHQHSSIHADPDDSHSQGMLDMTGNNSKRARCMHPAVDCALGLSLSSLPSHPTADHIPSPWRKRMRRGFLGPASTSWSEDHESPAGTCASVERQVMSLAWKLRGKPDNSLQFMKSYCTYLH